MMKLLFALSFINILSKFSLATNVTDQYRLQNEIVNPHDFKYILNPGHRICGLGQKPKVFLLIYVHTSPDNYKRRLSIRETWAKRSMFRDIRIVFMMGRTESTKTSEMILLENGIYGDLVQEDFIDSYRNLTYKGIMAMKWISEYCPKAKFILKVDDDIITNTFIILKHLKALENHDIIKQKTIMCLVWERGRVFDMKYYNHIYIIRLIIFNFI